MNITAKVFLAVSAFMASVGQTTSLNAAARPEKNVSGPLNPDEKIAFVFEVVRHGARAPIQDKRLDEFSVGEGLLTPEGMR